MPVNLVGSQILFRNRAGIGSNFGNVRRINTLKNVNVGDAPGEIDITFAPEMYPATAETLIDYHAVTNSTSDISDAHYWHTSSNPAVARVLSGPADAVNTATNSLRPLPDVGAWTWGLNITGSATLLFAPANGNWNANIEITTRRAMPGEFGVWEFAGTANQRFPEEWRHSSPVLMHLFTDINGPSFDSLYQEELRAIRGAGAYHTVQGQNGDPFVVNSARSYIAGNTFVDPSDIGTESWQVPTQISQATSERLVNHPNLFLVSGADVSGVGHCFFPDAAPPVASNASVAPYSVTTKPTHSLWRLVIDGADQLVYIPHGEADLRRPRDIYNTIIRRAMEINVLETALPYLASNIYTFQPNEVLRGLKFLDSAEMLMPMVSGSNAPPITRIDQQG